MAGVDVLARSSLWAEEAVSEDAGMGGVCAFQGLSLSEAAVADKDGSRLVKGLAGKKEEVVVAAAAVGIKGGCFKPGAVAGDSVEKAPAEKKRLTPLPPEEVQWILAQKPLPLIPSDDRETLLMYLPPEKIDRVMEIQREADEASAAFQKDFFEFQDWVRDEQEKYGVVMVDDEFLAGREQTCQWLNENFDDLFDRLEDDVSEVGNSSDLYATDDEEDQEGVLVDDLFTTPSEHEVDYVSREEFDRMDNESSDSEFGNYSDTYATDDEEKVALESTSD